MHILCTIHAYDFARRIAAAIVNTACGGHVQNGVSTTPPSALSAAPVVAEASGEQA